MTTPNNDLAALAAPKQEHIMPNLRCILMSIAAIAVAGCSEPIEAPDDAPESPYETVVRMTAEEQGISPEAAKVEIDAEMEREREIESIRQSDPALNWVNVGISTFKHSNSLNTSVHRTYEECVNHSHMKANSCFPISALPDSYWSAGE